MLPPAVPGAMQLKKGAAFQGAQWRLDHAAGWEASAKGQMQLHHSNTQPDSHGVQPVHHVTPPSDNP